MKLPLFILLNLLSFSTIYAQPWQWALRGGSVNGLQSSRDYNNISHLTTDAAGNIYTMGPVGSANLQVAGQPLVAYSDYGTGTSPDILLASFNPAGQLRWTKVIGGFSYDFGFDLDISVSGKIYVSGYVQNLAANQSQHTAIHFDTDTTLPKYPNLDTLQKGMFLVQYDTSGAFGWLRMPEPDTLTRHPSSKYHSLGYRTDVSSNGVLHWFGYLKAGEYAWQGDNLVSQTGVYVLKYNENGQVIGRVKLDMWNSLGTYQFASEPQFAYDSQRHRYYIGGRYGMNDSNLVIGGDTIRDDIYLAAFDTTGQVIWKMEGNSLNNNCGIEDLELDSLGNIYICGQTQSGSEFGGYHFDYNTVYAVPFIMKLNPQGQVVWGRHGEGGRADSYDLAIHNGEVALTGDAAFLWWPEDGDSADYDFNQGIEAYLARFEADSGTFIDMAQPKTNFGGSSHGYAIAAGPANTYYLGGNFSAQIYLGNDTLYKIGGNRSFFLSQYSCAAPSASFSFQATNSTNTLHLSYTGDPADSVQWYLGEGTRLWGNSVSHSYAVKDKYRVCAKAYFDCSESTACDSLSAGSIGLAEWGIKEVKLYPNPSSGQYWLTLPQEVAKIEVQVLDVSGKVVFQEGWNDVRQLHFDLANQPSGVYFMRARMEGELYHHRLIKQ